MTEWIGQFQRLPSWVEPAGALPILAVRFAHRMRGDRAFVRVTVHRGEKFYDVEEPVAEYEAAAGDHFVVKELEKFGIKPFEFDVARKVEAEPGEVEARFMTGSLRAVSARVDQRSSVVRVVLRNLSPKPVMALKLETRRGGQVMSIMWPLGREGRPVIEAGAEGEVAVGFGGGGGVMKGDGYAPALPDAVVVVSALFADGSYEGELRAASNAAAQYAGYRVQIARVLELVREALAAGDADAPGAAAKFKEKVLALGRDAEAHTVDEVFGSYAGLADGERESLKGSVEAAMDWMRRDVLAQVAPFEAKGAAGQLTFRGWLAAYDKSLSDWLARLRR
jgi:hypothetical protein